MNNKVELYDDNQTQLGAVKTAFQLRGHLKAGAVVINNQNQQVGAFIRTTEDLERIEKVMKRMEEINKKMLPAHSTGDVVDERQPKQLPDLDHKEEVEERMIFKSLPSKEVRRSSFLTDHGGFC